jgi:hypothetical protein
VHRQYSHKTNGGTVAHSARAPLKDLTAVRWIKLKTATVGRRSFVGAQAKSGRSLALVEVDTNRDRRGTLSS